MRTAPWRERDRGDHGQELRGQPHGERHREQERLQRRPVRATLAKRMKSTRKTTVCMMRRPNRRMPRSNSVSGGRVASRAAMSPKAVAGPVATTSGHGRPAHDRGAEEDDVRAPRPLAGRPAGRSIASFSAGMRLAGERGLLHVEVSRLHEAGVGGDEVAGGEANHVAGHELAARRSPPRPRRAGRSRSARPSRAAAPRPAGSDRSGQS